MSFACALPVKRVQSDCVSHTRDTVGDQHESIFAGGGSDAGLNALALLGSRLGQLGIDLAGVLPAAGSTSAEPREVGVDETGNEGVASEVEQCMTSTS